MIITIKQYKYTKEQEDFLKNQFLKISFCIKKYSKTNKIKEAFNLRFNQNKTQKAIARKLFKMGLKNYSVIKEEKIKIECLRCKQNYFIPKRYLKRILNKENFCEKCFKKNWSETEKSKKYQKEYRKQYHKNLRKNGN